jgi:hypothetical protein
VLPFLRRCIAMQARDDPNREHNGQAYISRHGRSGKSREDQMVALQTPLQKHDRSCGSALPDEAPARERLGDSRVQKLLGNADAFAQRRRVYEPGRCGDPGLRAQTDSESGLLNRVRRLAGVRQDPCRSFSRGHC